MGGFIGKFLLFTATIQAEYLLVALIALLMSMISVYYYFLVVKAMYVTKPADGANLQHVPMSNGIFIALVVCVVMSVVLGLFFGPAMTLTMTDASSLIM